MFYEGWELAPRQTKNPLNRPQKQEIGRSFLFPFFSFLSCAHTERARLKKESVCVCISNIYPASFGERQAACLCIVDPFTEAALALRSSSCRCPAIVPAAPAHTCFLAQSGRRFPPALRTHGRMPVCSLQPLWRRRLGRPPLLFVIPPGHAGGEAPPMHLLPARVLLLFFPPRGHKTEKLYVFFSSFVRLLSLMAPFSKAAERRNRLTMLAARRPLMRS